ncbi:MAG: hypothetical protein A2786_01800 [Candidatus Chisholmbacteria bacterium RIFCSPHIGHO2_01_FULL_52_32]|uniref:Uncharacterized protein n=1 Tax=Candidatus Chisholmbacteria bacterium RIFCSPHIGHO2_01_FULL_52_32 TaxID=1797591 RepID=A0A1G1VS62_9BACT|nr:MAG: hypothetical protein A2786_01800 [Candidatus Chisholmbacteria bacterium RIFCSPHIGHO2_01_FULL_52_32]
MMRIFRKVLFMYKGAESEPNGEIPGLFGTLRGQAERHLRGFAQLLARQSEASGRVIEVTWETTSEAVSGDPDGHFSHGDGIFPPQKEG